VKLDVLRNGKSKVVSLTLGQLPNDRQAKADSEGEGKGAGTDVAQLGLTLAPAGKADGAGKGGVVITKVEPKSAAADRGVKKGDVILEVAGKNVAKPGDVGDALEAARADKKNSVLMRLRSGDASRYVAVPLANG
jgi:serine protease Do